MRGWIGLIALLWAAACTQDETLPLYEVVPGEVLLPPVAWSDTSTDWFVVSILNTTFFNLRLSNVRVTGDATAVVELRDPGESQEIPVRGSGAVLMRVRTPNLERVAMWDDATYFGAIEFKLSGIPEVDPTTGAPDMSSYSQITDEVPVRATTRCDLDGDGDEARECSGADCDDSLAAVSSRADEACDDFDNNCNGAVDEGCDLVP